MDVEIVVRTNASPTRGAWAAPGSLSGCSGRSEVLSFDSLFARKIDLHQNVLLLKHFEYRRTLGYVGLVFVVRTRSTNLDVHNGPA